MRNERWHDDAIAFGKAFVANDRLEDVYAEDELERQIPVERFQEAAGDSARYFERIGRYVGLPPQPFTFNLLTRSGRITRANLEQRDPLRRRRRPPFDPRRDRRPDYRRGFLVEHASTVRNEAGVVTVTSGGITSLDEVNTILAAGRADLVTMDPGGYRDPRSRTEQR